MSITSPAHNRHGSWADYNAGCRCDDCREAARLYQKRLVYDRLNGRARKVSSVGLIRRVQALNALGWSNYTIADRAGVGREQIRQWCMRSSVYRASHEKVAAVFEELCMALPPERTRMERLVASRTRNKARRNGYLPPLAWDNIDDPDERPKLGRGSRRREDVDQAVVQRVLDGEELPTTRAEKDEITRRWRELGRPLRELERRFGWKPERYGRDVA